MIFAVCGAACAVAGFAGRWWLSVAAVLFILSTAADGYLREARASQWAVLALAGRSGWARMRGLVEGWCRVSCRFVLVEELAWAVFVGGGMALCYGVGVLLREFLGVV